MKRLSRNLIDSSIEAYILALETINRPTVSYKTEAFCFLFCNAWELLMKAKLNEAGENIYERKKRNKPRKSIGFLDCLNKVFNDGENLIRKNLIDVSELRNNATHLIIPFIPPGLIGLFQAGVINYPKKLQEWFNITLSDRVPLGMMALVYDFDPERHSLEHARMHRTLPSETINWLSDFQRMLGDNIQALGENAVQYCIPIDYKVAIVKNPNNADIIIGAGSHGRDAIVLEVPKNPDKTHPYRQNELIDKVKELLGEDVTFNRYDALCIRQAFDIDKNPAFIYFPKYSSPQYSEAFVQWIVTHVNTDPKFLADCRGKYHLYH